VTSDGLTPPTGAAWKALQVAVVGYEKLSAASAKRRPPTTAVNREIVTLVDEVTSEADSVVGLRLVAPDRAELPAWRPGAHVDLLLASGRLRQYSLCGDPDDRTCYRIAVRRIEGVGGGSREVHEALHAGSPVTVRGPRNAFPFITVDRYLFVAGGIGITPIRPMLYDAVRRGADWSFVYTGRTRASMPFLDELIALDPSRVHIWPDDEFGVPEGLKILATAPDGAALYCCGPPPMIEAIRAEIPRENIATLHYERFSAPPVVGGVEFEIELARSGQVITVGAEQSALAALRAVVAAVAYSCQQGFCGTCPVTVLAGDVEHHDRCLTDSDRESKMAVCVSRGRGRITLDL
jgi:ferredoxin-NADP reductase